MFSMFIPLFYDNPAQLFIPETICYCWRIGRLILFDPRARVGSSQMTNLRKWR